MLVRGVLSMDSCCARPCLTLCEARADVQVVIPFFFVVPFVSCGQLLQAYFWLPPTFDRIQVARHPKVSYYYEHGPGKVTGGGCNEVRAAC